MDNICTYAESVFESYIKKIIRRIDENEKNNNYHAGI